jgi:hypothetical protein
LTAELARDALDGFEALNGLVSDEHALVGWSCTGLEVTKGLVNAEKALET